MLFRSRILPVGGSIGDKQRWTEYYHVYEVICFTERENIPSMSLLKKLGYTNLGYLPSKNPQVFGKWLRQDTLEEITSAVR